MAAAKEAYLICGAAELRSAKIWLIGPLMQTSRIASTYRAVRFRERRHFWKRPEGVKVNTLRGEQELVDIHIPQNVGVVGRMTTIPARKNKVVTVAKTFETGCPSN